MSIKELCELVGEIVGYQGQIVWDHERPDGQMKKTFDVQRSRNLGIECQTRLKSGLKKTYDGFAKNYEAKTDGLRL